MRKLVFTIPILFLGGIYILTLAPSVPAQGDAGELITVAYYLGIAHPPGYPLYTLIGHLFTLLPWNSVAWRMNLMAGLSHLLAVIFIYLALVKITKNKLAALGAAMALGLSYTFWLYSLVAEVFSLSDLLVSAIIFLTVTAFFERNTGKRFSRIVLIVFLFGLGMANQQTVILMAPAVAYLLYPAAKKIFFSRHLLADAKNGVLLGLAFLIGLSPYLYIYFRAKDAVLPVSWTYPSDFPALWRLATRADYGTFTALTGRDPAAATIAEKGNQLINYFRFLVDDFGLMGIFLIGPGMLVGWRHYRRLTIFLLIGFLISGLLFLTYANFPIKEFSGTALEVVERFYLLPNIFLGMFMALSLSFFWDFMDRRKILRLLPIPITIFFLTVEFFDHYFVVDQSQNFIPLNFAKDLLSSAAPHSLIVFQGDIPLFTTFYARYVENYRPDIEMIYASQVAPDNKYRYLRQVHPELDFNFPAAATPAGVFAANWNKVPIYSLGSVPTIGLIASPAGLLTVYSPPAKLAPFADWLATNEAIIGGYKQDMKVLSGKNLPLADQVIVAYYGQMDAILGNFCRSAERFDCAQQFYQSEVSLVPSDAVAHFNLAEVYQKEGKCDLAEKEYLGILSLGSNRDTIYQKLADLASDCFNDPEREQKYRNANATRGTTEFLPLDKL